MGVAALQSEWGTESYPEQSGNQHARNVAIEEYGYGPERTGEINATFWRDRAAFMGTTTQQAQGATCSRCSLLSISSKSQAWVAGVQVDDYDSSAKGNFGFCTRLGFKANYSRTCDSWTPGVPSRR